MGKRTWEVTVYEGKHVIKLRHGYFTGKRIIWLDGNVIEESRKISNHASQYFFSIEDKKCEVGITSNGFTYAYYLLVDNVFIPSIEKKSTPNKKISAIINESNSWIKLSQALNVDYIPLPKAQGFRRHRIIGSINGLLTVVRHGQRPQSNKPVYAIIVRYSPLLNTEEAKEALLNHAAINEIRGNLKSQKETFEIQKDVAWITLPYNSKKDSTAQITDNVLQFINILSNYAQPLPQNICEGERCGLKSDHRIKLVFIGSFPRLLCENCIAEIPTINKKARDAYQESPTKLMQGMAVGAGVALLGGILWALVSIIPNNTITSLGILLIPTFMMVGIIRSMDQVGTKRTIWSILTAMFLSIVGVIFGAYLSSLFYVIKEYSVMPSTEIVVKAWQHFWSNSKALYTALFIFLFIALQYAWTIWSNTKSALSRVFEPDVEIIEV